MSASACSGSRPDRSAYTIHDKQGHSYRVRIMPDGKAWTTDNFSMDVRGSSCYDSLPSNCERYGRLYPWKTAMAVCRQLGEGWRLPLEDEWRRLGKNYGGVFDDSSDNGKAAYVALMIGGSSQFDALLGGGRDPQGHYKRLGAHGFYWTSTGVSDSTAWFCNFGNGRPAFYLQNDGDKPSAYAVRCVKDPAK